MKITWIRCHSYDDAKNHSRIIYLHEWHRRPFHWGKADVSFFGDHKREYDGLHAATTRGIDIGLKVVCGTVAVITSVD
jgi:hypothetical protein